MNRHLLFTYLCLSCIPMLAQKQVNGIVVNDRGHTVFASVYTPSDYGLIVIHWGTSVLKYPPMKIPFISNH